MPRYVVRIAARHRIGEGNGQAPFSMYRAGWCVVLLSCHILPQ
jgi:hypothetical protein